MVKTIKFLSYTLFFLGMITFFTPKENLYFLLEKQLSKYDLVISDEQLTPQLFSLDINNATIYFKEIELAEVQGITMKPFGVYNLIEFHNLKLSTMSKNFLPPKVETIQLKYTLLQPLYITIDAIGDFGAVTLRYAIKEKKITATLKPSKVMLQRYRSSLRKFKKNKNGEYTYATSL
jgi:hypothetical protein